MGKILALDLGDKWVGSALSDALHIIARPHKTVTADELDTFLADLLTHESIEEIIVGYPKTLKGTKSQQTEKVEAEFNRLTHQFPHVTFKLWDERLTSKKADTLSKTDKASKIASHSKAAAFILDSYLGYCAFSKKNDDE